MFADPVSSARSVTEKPPRCVTSVSVNGQLICRNSLIHRRKVLEIFDYYITLYRHYVPWSLNWNKKRDNEVQCSPLWMTPTGLEDIHATPCHNICRHDARRVDEWKVNDDAAAWHQKRIVRPVAGPQSATTRTVEQISGPPAIHTTHQRHHRFMYSRPSLVHESLNNSSFTSGLVMIEYTFFRLVHSRASKRERKRERETGKEVPVFDATHKAMLRRVSKLSDGFVGTGCLYLTFSFLGDSRTHVNQITVIRLSCRLAAFAG